MRSSDEVLDKIIKTNARLKEMLEADRKKKRYHSPAEGMTKAEIWECMTGERLTDEQVEAKIKASYQLPRNPAALV